MKTTLLFIALLFITQRYKTSEPAPVSYNFFNSNDFCGFDNFIGWDNTSFQLQSLLHLEKSNTPLFFTGETLRMTLPISKEYYWQDTHDNIFTGHNSNFCQPGADTCYIETDSEIKIPETDTLLFCKTLSLPGC